MVSDDSIAALADAGREIARLRDENQRLRVQAERVAEANAYAAETMVELEAARADMEEKGNYLKALFDSLPVGIMTVDPRNHQILDLNTKAVQMIGRPRGVSSLIRLSNSAGLP